MQRGMVKCNGWPPFTVGPPNPPNVERGPAGPIHSSSDFRHSTMPNMLRGRATQINLEVTPDV